MNDSFHPRIGEERLHLHFVLKFDMLYNRKFQSRYITDEDKIPTRRTTSLPENSSAIVQLLNLSQLPGLQIVHESLNARLKALTKSRLALHPRHVIMETLLDAVECQG